MPHKITAKLDNASQWTHTHSGERHVTVECKLTGEGIELALPVRVVLPADAPDDSAEAVATAVAKDLPALFQSEPDVFRKQSFELAGKLPKPDNYKKPITFEVDSKAFEALCEQSAHYAAARSSFDDAVSKLRGYGKLGSGGVQANKSEILLQMAFIENCLAAADLGTGHNWYHEKIERVRAAFSDLLRRTDSNHSGYKASQQEIDYSLYGYHAPERWTDRPPTMK